MTAPEVKPCLSHVGGGQPSFLHQFLSEKREQKSANWVASDHTIDPSVDLSDPIHIDSLLHNLHGKHQRCNPPVLKEA